MPINPSDLRSGPLAALSPRHLAAFVAVVEASGFAAAAASLGLAQSTVSTLLRDMEDRLGTQLIERTTRRTTPTAAGARLLPHARRLLAEMQAILHEIDPPGARQVRIAATPLVAGTLLPEALARLQAAGRVPRPALVEASPTEIPDLVRRGEASLGLGSFPRAEVADLGRRHLGRDDLVLFCPDRHPLASRREALHWRDLAGTTEIAVTRESEVGRLVSGALEAAGLSSNPSGYEVARIGTALAFVAAGLGVAVLPRSAAPLVPRSGAPVRIRVLRSVIRREVLAIWRGAAAPNGSQPILRALIEAGQPRA